MDYYSNAEDQLQSANILSEAGKYRTPVTLLCLACELFLKSLAEYKIPDSPLMESHDVIALGEALREEIDFKRLRPYLNTIRKYHNDSRYPFDPKVYTKEFYGELLQIVLVVKSEIDKVNASKSTRQALEEKFGKDKVIDTSKEERK